MNNALMSPPLQRFVDTLSSLVDTDPSEADLLPKVGDAMAALVKEDNWLPESVSVPHPDYYQQYLLYADPNDRFSVVSFVWGPGQETPLHDHTVWGVIGMLRGAETEQAYTLGEDGGVPHPTGDLNRLNPGDVAFVSPRIGDLHRVSNAYADQVSISIHAYGANIGKVQRHVFPLDGGPAKDFVSGYSDPVN